MSNICINPWIHVEADATGRAKPCCLYDSNKAAGHFSTDSLSQIWISEEMTTLRNEFLAGKKPEGCKQCWDNESRGIRSKRQADNERFQHLSNRIGNKLGVPVYFDLKLGTVCNLKCRICSSFSSFKWAEDEKLLYGEVLNPNLRSYWIEDDSRIWRDLAKIVEHIEWLDFTGGEPLLIKKHFELLEKCVEQGHAHKIGLHYNTNTTIKPTQRMLDIWKEFKWVELMFSVDGVGSHFEYQRHPAVWKEAEENLRFVNEHKFLHTSICHTVNIFNLLYLPEFEEWFNTLDLPEDRLFLNALHSPAHYNVQAIPEYAHEAVKKKLTKEKYQPFVTQMSNYNGSIENFFKYTHILDKHRKESFQQVFPELDALLRGGY